MNAQHDDAMLDLVAAHAAGAVDATTEECATVRQHIAECQVCRDEYNLARAAAAAVGLTASEAPPPGLRARVLRSVSRQVVPQARSRRISWIIPASAAAAVVIIAAGLWWSGHRTPSQSWSAVCVATAADCHATGTVSVAGRGRLHVELQGLAALPAGKQYQAWIIPPGGAPKPEPTFSPGSDGAGSVDVPEAPEKGALLAITVEPAGGSQQPTTKPFLIATLD